MKNKMKAWRRPGVQKQLRTQFIDSIVALVKQGAMESRRAMDVIHSTASHFGRQAKQMMSMNPARKGAH